MIRTECDIDRERIERECEGDSKGVECGEEREIVRHKVRDRVGYQVPQKGVSKHFF